MVVGVADARADHVDEDLPVLRRLQIDLFHGQEGTGLMQYGGSHVLLLLHCAQGRLDDLFLRGHEERLKLRLYGTDA